MNVPAKPASRRTPASREPLATREGLSDVVFRALFSSIFTSRGAVHLVRPSVFVEQLGAAAFGYVASLLGTSTLRRAASLVR